MKFRRLTIILSLFISCLTLGPNLADAKKDKDDKDKHELNDSKHCSGKKKDKHCEDDTPPLHLRAEETQLVDFGRISTSTNRCTMNDDGSLSGDCYGAGILGEMAIKGRPYYAYEASVQSHGWQNDARFTPKIVMQTHLLNGLGSDRVSIKGTIQLKRNFTTTSGKVNMTYTFTVYYQ